MYELFTMQAIVQFNPESPLFIGDANLKERLEKKFGKEKTYTVNRVIHVPEDKVSENHGHQQKIEIFFGGEKKSFSGAYFKRYSPKVVPLHLQAYEELCVNSKKESK